MIYLVSPYSDPDPAIRQRRHEAACRAVVAMLHASQAVYSPIVFGHALVSFGLPTDWAFWARFDREHLQRCDEVVVLTLPGWQESVGVQAEIAIAEKLGKRIRYLVLDQAVVSPTVAYVATKPAG